MSTLIFDNKLDGHHLEYLHHLYEGATRKVNEKFIFAVPRDKWQKMKDNWSWEDTENIVFYWLNDRACDALEKGNLITRSYKLSRIINQVRRAVNAEKIILIMLAGVIPFLPLMLPSRVKISGIIYQIYLRNPKKGLRRIMDWLRYSILAWNKSIKTAYILNDVKSASELNRIYHSNHFQSLPDPVPEINHKEVSNLRYEFGISTNSTVFLHFGAMAKRKGTIEILQAINTIPQEQLKDKTFIFAGKVGRDIRDEFYTLTKKAINEGGTKIIIRDEFCGYGYINSLCLTADCILIPYLNASQSSGVIGYAALFNKPVIGPKDGLIGEIIHDNNLGECININPDELRKAIVNFNRQSVDGSNYIKNNSKERFTELILR